MRRYEIMVILTDTIEEEDALASFERVKAVVVAQGGTVVDEAWWGKRELAYEINKRSYGFYSVLDLNITDEGRTEVERQMKLSDNIVRFKTVRPHIRVRQFS